jgi:mannosyltransferase
MASIGLSIPIIAAPLHRRTIAAATVAVVTAVGAVLRLVGGSAQSIRLDEAQTIYFASFPLQPVNRGPYVDRISLFQATAMDIHPPGYLLLMHFWMALFGTAPEMLRLPSEVAGSLCAPALYLLGSVLYDRRVGILAALLGALSPYWIWHAQEARMYAFLTLFVVLSTYGLVNAVIRRRPWGWAIFSLFSVLGLHFHYFMALTLFAQALWVVSQFKKLDRRGRALAAGAAALVVAAYVPWLAEVARTAHGSGDPILQTPDAYTPLILLAQFLFGYLAVPMTSQLVAAWPLLVLVGLGLGVYGGRPSWRGALGWSLFLVPCLITFGAALTWRPLVAARYLVGVTPALYLLISQAAVRLLDKRRLAITLAGVAPLLLAGDAVQSHSDQNPASEDYSRAVSYIESNTDSDDVVLLDSYFNRYPYSYYSHRTSPTYDIPPPPGRAGSQRNLDEAGIADYLNSISAGHRHLWVIYYLEYRPGRDVDVRRYLDYHTVGHRVIFGPRFGRGDRHDPGSQTNVHLVKYDLAPTGPKPIQIRPANETEIAAMSGVSPNLRNPYAAPFDDRAGFGTFAAPHPLTHWYFPRLHNPRAQQTVSVFNPNQTPVRVAVKALTTEGEKVALDVPAASGADVQLESLSAAVVEAPLEVEAPQPVIATKVVLEQGRRMEFHGYSDPTLVQSELSSRAWVTDIGTAGQPMEFSRPSCGSISLWTGSLNEPSGRWTLFRKENGGLTRLDAGSWTYDVHRGGDQQIATIAAGEYGGGDLVARIDLSGGEGDNPPGRPAYFYMDCGINTPPSNQVATQASQ